MARRFRCIGLAQELGFFVEESRGMPRLRVAFGARCSEIQGRTAHRIDALLAKIAVLERMRLAAL